MALSVRDLRPERSGQARRHETPSLEGVMRYRSDQHAEDWNEMERRQLLRVTAGTVGAILTAAPPAKVDGPDVDLLDELEATTSRLRVRDHRFGTPTALVQATRHVERLTRLL